ncbi:hypothetical protein EQG49_10570 [Periweissella cryptocerci]|uniref:Uncharacterized protein n=1 Tax=Periweissella cryptocerci TaxID=2506420 RepID=A0A4P6YVM3_9LACO|nr:hypothetical protein [Periweissella cryptocerci]QBO36854.1 hypothetical protein EQG49_10570 [Periweissella cryptocerci]
MIKNVSTVKIVEGILLVIASVVIFILLINDIEPFHDVFLAAQPHEIAFALFPIIIACTFGIILLLAMHDLSPKWTDITFVGLAIANVPVLMMEGLGNYPVCWYPVIGLIIAMIGAGVERA